jgi:hypothetical protein
MYSTRSRALIWLTVIWLVARIYPALMGWSSLAACGEVVAVRKLLEIGFQRLHGAQILPVALYGTVAHPEHYVVARGPYPILWFYALLYYCFGFVGVSAVLYLLKYAGLVLSFLVLERCFSRAAAFWAAVLYAVAPLYVLCDGTSNAIILSTVFWPVGLALIVFRLHCKEARGPSDLLLAGATTFLAGQTCYFALSFIPALMVINSRVASPRLRAIRAVATDPVSLAFLVGGVLSLLVWLGQVALYEGGLSPMTNYALNKAGVSAGTVHRLYILGLIPLRISFFVGAGLALASLLGCVCLVKDRNLLDKPPVSGVLVYFLVFAAMVLAAPAAFVQENHFYSWLVFPGTVMAAMLFDKAGQRLRNLVLGCGGLSLILALLYAGVPLVASPVSVYLGKVFAAHSKRTDFIFTNIKPFARPYKGSDIGGEKSTQFTADRYITFGVLEPAQLCLAWDLPSEDSKFQYWRLRSLRISPALEAGLGSKGKLLKTIPLTFPPATETLPEKLRGFVWYSVMKKGKRLQQDSGSLSDSVDVYEIELPPESLVDYSPVGPIPPRTNTVHSLPQK